MGTWDTITTSGTTARCYLTGDGTAGVVLFHAWWGLVDDVVAFADRLAAAGFTVAAPDLVAGKTAATIAEAEQIVETADEDLANAVALAAVDALAARLGPDARIATIGFSFGAHWSMWCGAERDRVAASVVYYGTTGGGHLARGAAPVLGHFAADDPFESAEGVAEFEQALRDADRTVTIHTYPGTGHWFAEPSQGAYRPEPGDLAFSRTIAFLRDHLGSRL